MIPTSIAAAQAHQRSLFDTEFGVGPSDDTGRYLSANRPVWVRRARFARRHLARGGSVLDVGCGDGSIAQAVVDRAGDYFGVDVSPVAIAAARRRLPAARFAVTGVEDLGDEGPFDLVMAYEVIEHLADPHAVVAHIAQLLSPRGVVVLSTPNRDRLTNRLRRSRRRLLGLDPRIPLIPSHFFELVPAELEQLLEDHGLRVLERRDDILFDAKFLPSWEPLQHLNVWAGSLLPTGASAMVLAARRSPCPRRT
jgi:SAM-dependent methyltransferase